MRVAVEHLYISFIILQSTKRVASEFIQFKRDYDLSAIARAYRNNTCI